MEHCLPFEGAEVFYLVVTEADRTRTVDERLEVIEVGVGMKLGPLFPQSLVRFEGI